MPYFIAMLLIISLGLFKNLTPEIFFVVVIFSLILIIISPSATLLASLFPLVGFLFSGENRVSPASKRIFRYSIYCSIFLCYVAFFIFPPDFGTASHNYLSVLIVYAFVAEIIYFGNPTKLYIPLILLSFFFIGNRSSIFLLLPYMKSKLTIILFCVVAVLFIAITLGEIDAFGTLKFLFQEGGLLNRSYKETRGDYLDEFLRGFDFFNLGYDKWSFNSIPETSNGFYDLHNSFLTIIVRDSYLGLFKIALWISQILFLPIGFFMGISFRAYYDTFLLGGVNDILLYSLIGSSYQRFFKRVINIYKNLDIRKVSISNRI
ncbi:MAG TPA: hypothetical protein VGD22_01035 [Sphingobacteriaceae bacterium]